MPPARTPAKRKPAAPSRGAAARAEVTGDQRTIDFNDVTLTLPAEIPPTILFDLQIIRASGDDPQPVFALLHSLVGHDQFVKIRDAVRPDDDVAQVVDQLLTDILGSYGTTPGESSASPSS